jgi:hypothetical protein
MLHAKDNCGLNAHPGSTVASLREYEYGQLCIAMYQHLTLLRRHYSYRDSPYSSVLTTCCCPMTHTV